VNVDSCWPPFLNIIKWEHIAPPGSRFSCKCD
jgi:hypothetical protein